MPESAFVQSNGSGQRLQPEGVTGQPVGVPRAPNRDERFYMFLGDIQKEVAWMTGHTMTGLVISDKGGSWLLVLKAHNGGVAKVAFFECQTIMECYRQLWAALRRKKFDWRIDRFAGGG